jgi:hypothetical protein
MPEALVGFAEYTTEKFKAKAAAITVPDDGVLVIYLQGRLGTYPLLGRTALSPAKARKLTDEMKPGRQRAGFEGEGSKMANVQVIPAPARSCRRSQRRTPSTRRVASYARVSTDSDEQLTSYEAQVDYTL